LAEVLMKKSRAGGRAGRRRSRPGSAPTGPALPGVATSSRSWIASTLSRTSSWPAATTATLGCLAAHWRTHGRPRFAQFDNDTRFQGPHQHRDVIGRVSRCCLQLGITPIFVPPSTGGAVQPTGVAESPRPPSGVWGRSFHRRRRLARVGLEGLARLPAARGAGHDGEHFAHFFQPEAACHDLTQHLDGVQGCEERGVVGVVVRVDLDDL